ncbi:MAG: sulfite exporter TauE/SafE family protein [Roseobacter sp.]
MDTLTVSLIASAAFFMSGAVKGVTGIGLPTAAIALMTLFLDPRTAIALVLFPMLGSNLWQMLRGGYILRTARRYRLFAVILFLGVGSTAFATQHTSDRALLAFLGIVVLIFVVVSWRKLLPPLADRYDTAAQICFALLAGVIGGMTAAWGPPMAMYLAAKGVDKDEFIRATGFMISLGSLPLVFAYAKIGFLNGPLAGMSMAMLVPTLIGLLIGEYFRRRMSVETFRNAILVLFLVLGLNLIRRAIWYV